MGNLKEQATQVCGQLDLLKDRIVHGRPYDAQDAIHWLCVAADLIEQLPDIVDKSSAMEKQRDSFNYSLLGVMHSVDKWLDGIQPYHEIEDYDGNIAVNRAADAREVTLRCIEKLTTERDEWKLRVKAAEHDMDKSCRTCVYNGECHKWPCFCINGNAWRWRGVCEENGGGSE